MLNKKIIISFGVSLLLFSIIFLYGCNTEPSFNVEIYKGTKGLEVYVMRSAPPREVYEDEPFKVVAKLVNEGAYPINKGVFSINYERTFIELLNGQKSVSFDLKGKGTSNIWDDEELITFDLRSKYLDEKSEKHTSILMLTSCYDYETIATFGVCIDTNVFETRPESAVCSVRDITSSGQGSPLAVVRVEEEISGGEYITPHFTIYIQNRGKGHIIKYGNKDACSSKGIGAENFNVVALEDVELSDYSLSGGQIRCSPNIIRLTDGEAKIRCSLDGDYISSNEPSFMTSLKIHLKYGYTRTDSFEIDILNDESKD
jgi:hypothetical protein